MGGGWGRAGGGGSREGSRVKLSWNDTGGLGSSRDVMEGIGEAEGSPECRVRSRQGGARGRMVTGCNEQRPQRHS